MADDVPITKEIESVARAICVCSGDNPDQMRPAREVHGWAALEQPVWMNYVPHARAAFFARDAENPIPVKRTRTINDIGIGMSGVGNERLRDIRVYAESGVVQIWVEIIGSPDALQYLTPEEAMSFSKAFKRCAVQALKERTD